MKFVITLWEDRIFNMNTIKSLMSLFHPDFILKLIGVVISMMVSQLFFQCINNVCIFLHGLDKGG